MITKEEIVDITSKLESGVKPSELIGQGYNSEAVIVAVEQLGYLSKPNEKPIGKLPKSTHRSTAGDTGTVFIAGKGEIANQLIMRTKALPIAMPYNLYLLIDVARDKWGLPVEDYTYTQFLEKIIQQFLDDREVITNVYFTKSEILEYAKKLAEEMVAGREVQVLQSAEPTAENKPESNVTEPETKTIGEMLKETVGGSK